MSNRKGLHPVLVQILANLPSLVAVLGLLFSGYLNSRYNSEQSNLDWKKGAYANFLSEAMFVFPKELLQIEVNEKDTCPEVLKDLDWGSGIYVKNRLQNVDDSKVTRELDLALGKVLLLADAELREKLKSFRIILRDPLLYFFVGPVVSEQTFQLMKESSRRLCSENFLQKARVANNLQQEIQGLMRKEIGMR